MLSLFISQTCLESPVLLSRLMVLNDEMWLLYLVLNVVDVSPMYSYFWSPDLTIDLYTRESVKHLPSSGHVVAPPLQLHPFIWVACSEFYKTNFTKLVIYKTIVAWQILSAWNLTINTGILNYLVDFRNWNPPVKFGNFDFLVEYGVLALNLRLKTLPVGN